MPLVQCKTCRASAVIPEGEDPHARTFCSCCTASAADEAGVHHHGEAANACPRRHDGPCWQGPESGPKPDGCTVCRPLLFFANASVAPAAAPVPAPAQAFLRPAAGLA
jgi:hypothetical protein